ncbi:phage baseplate assembly protein [Pararoseomonas indoligenes]|uniref:Phage tail protein n=1 Tax=Roseomonas indoligenes TaxID=2820811 RepID=A0A940MUW8_9PROT|nr:contractile injection system protein, VgrG/Pvc8 family [Pararoseomonas indoligenes]MBP0492158.1 hypothetical protein [Pararoseomonas indoligenes]
MPDDGDLELVVGGKALTGWQEIRITRGVERCPSDFDIAITERFTDNKDPTPTKLAKWTSDLVVAPGQACQVRIRRDGTSKGDLVITGYVDRYTPTITPRSHTVRISGRGRCQDLVDCAAYLRREANQVSNVTTKALIEKLCEAYGISVTALSGEGEIVPQFNVILTETAWDIIDRVCRHSGFLAYEAADGNLILSRAGKEEMASGFAQGMNVEEASANASMDQRYSLYEVVWQSMDVLNDLAGALGGDRDPNRRVWVLDETVGSAEPKKGERFRPRVIVSDQEQDGIDIAQRRALWERNRRNGRSASIRVVTDSWRDTSGQLWEPNHLVPVNVPLLRVVKQKWLIGEVTYVRGRDGTHAELLLMPPAAYEPEPIVLQPFDRQVSDALKQSALEAGGAFRTSGTGSGV